MVYRATGCSGWQSVGNPAVQNMGNMRACGQLALEAEAPESVDLKFTCTFSLEKRERPSVPAQSLSRQPRGSSQGHFGGPGLEQGWDKSEHAVGETETINFQ